MNIFDVLFYNVFSYYKTNYKIKANSIAVAYISILQCLLMLLLGLFFAKFFSQMHVDTMSQDKAIVLFIMGSVFLWFKNWLQYTGRHRMVINSKMIKRKSNTYNIYLLWFILFACLGLIIVLVQAV